MSPLIMGLTSNRGAFLVRKAHEIALSAETDTGDVDAVVILTATGVEAFLNQLERLADSAGVDPEGRMKSLGQILADAERGRAQLSLKYQLAYFVLSGQSIDRGSALYQAFSRLVALRNDLVHPKPIYGDDSTRLAAHPHVRYFLDRGTIGPDDLRGHLTWDRAVLRPKVAAWAYGTAMRSIGALIDLMPDCRESAELRRCWPDNLPVPSDRGI